MGKKKSSGVSPNSMLGMRRRLEKFTNSQKLQEGRAEAMHVSGSSEEEAKLPSASKEEATRSCPGREEATLSHAAREEAKLSRAAREVPTVSCSAREEPTLSCASREETTLSCAAKEEAKLSCTSEEGAEASTVLTDPWLDLGHGSFVGHWPLALDPDLHNDLFKRMLHDVVWQQRSVTIMGRRIPQPRLVAYFATEPELQGPYKYSGLALEPARMADVVGLLELKGIVEALAGLEGPEKRFNSCLMNMYRDGSDHVSWHSDDEKLYGKDPTIASLSLGTRRTFVLRSNLDPKVKHRFLLGEGDMLVMRGAVQRQWQHSIMKQPTASLGPRISLTFRRVTRPEHATIQ